MNKGYKYIGISENGTHVQFTEVIPALQLVCYLLQYQGASLKWVVLGSGEVEVIFPENRAEEQVDRYIAESITYILTD